MKPFFSIIIPVYNVKPYIHNCLDSIANQTFTDWEAICVDDGSTDGSSVILDEYACCDSRFKVVHQVNSGVEIARNVGFSCSNGERIIFMDGDDLMPSNYLTAHKNALSKAPIDTVTYSAHMEIYPDGRQEDCSAIYKAYDNRRDLCLSMAYNRWSPIIHGWVWPRSIIIRGGVWRTDIIANDDFEFSFRHIALAKNFRYVRDARAIYNKHANGLSHMAHNSQFYLSILDAMAAREKYALDIEDSIEMRMAVAQLWYSLLFHPDFIVNSSLRQYIWLRLKRIGLPKCFCYPSESKKGIILKIFGIRGLLVASLINVYYRKWSN